MRTTIKFDGVTHEQLRAILAACSQQREHISGDWEPRVSCDGAYFAVKVPPIRSAAACALLLQLDQSKEG